MRRSFAILLTSVVSLLVVAGAAQAVVVDMGAAGQFGVALVPGTDRATAGIQAVTSSPPCSDPWLSLDLGGPLMSSTGLCWHGGAVIHSNETFDLAWDPLRRDWATTRDYVEQFLRDVANGSGTLTSPYAVTTQYKDATGRAGNASLYGGGCIDYGIRGGSTCQFGNSNGTGPGNSYPPNGCPVTGTNQFHQELSGAFDSVANDVCLTDAQLKGELATMIAQEGLVGHTQPGYTPLLVLQTPPGVETCLDAGGTLCSANGASAARFCSYHSQVDVGGTQVAYVVQPWTASWTHPTGCDEPDAPVIPLNPPAQTLATDIGIRLVSPLSQGQLAAIVNPGLNGWFALDGSEINDNGYPNGCVPFGNGLDSVTVGSIGYLLQREFNNAGVIESDPNAPACTPSVSLSPTFVVPSAANPGDVVEFDGSKTVSTLIVPNGNYLWDFGDGTSAVGPSVVHSYAKGGTYAVRLTVIDRGGNVSSLSQTINVLGPTGQPVSPPSGSPGVHAPSPGLLARIQLMPQGLRAVLRQGVAIQVSSNEPADGIATISISRNAARRAHIRPGRGATVVIGRGTVSGIKDGTVQLYVRLSRAMAAKLRRLRHVTLTARFALVAARGDHLAIVAAGRY
jgi:hypothetical protein